MKRKLSISISMILVLLMVFSAVSFALTSVPVNSITLNKTSITLAVGKTITLTAIISPQNATNKAVTWSSSDNNVAKVNSKGIVTAVKEGKAIITAKSSNGKAVGKSTVTVSKHPDITAITFYGAPNAMITSVVGDNPDNTPFMKAFSQLFKDKYGYNINHQYIFCGAEEAVQRQQLIIASGEPWDIMGGIENAYPGGSSAAGNDGIIADWMKYKDHIPNILKLFNQQPMLAKQLKTDKGALYSVGDVRLTNMSSIWFGPWIRKDLLTKAGISALPETIQEWHDDLIKLKNAGLPHTFTYGISWFTGYSNAFVSAWDGAGYPQTDGGMSIIVNDAGKAVYGAGSDGFKQWLTEMNKWYKEGILDVDGFTNADWGISDTNITTGKDAAGIHFLGDLGNCDTQGKTVDPKFQLAGTLYPVLHKGDQPRMGQWDPMGIPGAYINAESKYITEILDYIDLNYGPEGQMLHNYGIKGKTYTMDSNGKPQFTDYYKCNGKDNKNSDGYNKDQVNALYKGSGNTVFDPAVWYTDNSQTKAQRDAIPLWDNVKRPANEIRFVSFTSLESEVTKKRVDLDTYASQQMLQFIVGQRPLSEYSKYVNELKTKYSMDKIVNVYNNAIQRYRNR